jgi:hypothetical protein
LVLIFALTAKRFAERSLDLPMNDARKFPVRKLPLHHFSASLCQSQPSFMIINQLDTVLGQIFRISGHYQRIASPQAIFVASVTHDTRDACSPESQTFQDFDIRPRSTPKRAEGKPACTVKSREILNKS